MKASFVILMASTLALCVCAQDKAYRPEVSKMLVNNGTPSIVKANGDTIKGNNVSLPPAIHAHEKWIKFDDGLCFQLLACPAVKHRHTNN